MAKTLQSYGSQHLLLMPICLQESQSEGDLAYLISDELDHLDLSAIKRLHKKERGYPPCHPRVVLKVLMVRLQHRRTISSPHREATARGYRLPCSARARQQNSSS